MARGRSRVRSGENFGRFSNGFPSRSDRVEDWLVGGDPLPRPLPLIRRSDVLEHDFDLTTRPQSTAVDAFLDSVPDRSTKVVERFDSFEATPPLRVELRPTLDPVGCFRRGLRREVLHALGIAGKKGLGRGGVKRKAESSYKC